MARAVECDTSPGFHLLELRRMRQDAGVEKLVRVQRQNFVVHGRAGNRIQRTPAVNDRNVRGVLEFRDLLRRHHAMMCAVAPAAGRQIRFRGTAERKERGDQRKAEQQQQRDGGKPAHRWTTPC